MEWVHTFSELADDVKLNNKKKKKERKNADCGRLTAYSQGLLLPGPLVFLWKKTDGKMENNFP